MPSSTQTLAAIADATGIPAHALGRMAAALQSDGMWPKGGQGGGKNTQLVELDHLINLVLTAAGAEPIAAAPLFVTSLCEGVPLFPREAFPGANLREALRNIIDGLARGRDLGLSNLTLTIRLHPGLPPEAKLEAGYTKKRKCNNTYCIYTKIPHEYSEHPKAAFCRTVELNTDLFNLLSALYADTIECMAKNSGKASANAKPETESAALPARRTAPIRDQDRHNSSPGTSTTPEAMRARKTPQARSGGPCSSQRCKGARRHGGHPRDAHPADQPGV